MFGTVLVECKSARLVAQCKIMQEGKVNVRACVRAGVRGCGCAGVWVCGCVGVRAYGGGAF